MKKKSVSFQVSDKSVDLKAVKKQKHLFKFQIEQASISCFIDKSRKNKIELDISKTEMPLKSNEQKNILPLELKISRPNRNKSTSFIVDSQKAFTNKLLLLEYEQQEGYADTNKAKQNQSKEQELQDQEVDELVNSCMRVITEQTDSSNPLSHRYTPQTSTPKSEEGYEVPMIIDPHYYYYMLKSELAATSGRNKRTISSEESNAYIIDLSRVESDGRTTIMVRNIPNKYTQDMLLELFEKNHKKKFDFFYLPIDYNNSCNVGYAFLNFIHTKFIPEFYQEFHHRKWNKFNSVKVCNVCYARIQGTAQLENHFEHSNVLQQKQKKYRPLIGLKTLTDNINSLVQRQKKQENAKVEQGSKQQEE